MDGSQRETDKKHFFINICHKVLQEGQARGCPEDAAVCSVGECAQSRGRGGGFPAGVWSSAASSSEPVRKSSCGLCTSPLSQFSVHRVIKKKR